MTNCTSSASIVVFMHIIILEEVKPNEYGNEWQTLVKQSEVGSGCLAKISWAASCFPIKHTTTVIKHTNECSWRREREREKERKKQSKTLTWARSMENSLSVRGSELIDGCRRSASRSIDCLVLPLPSMIAKNPNILMSNWPTIKECDESVWDLSADLQAWDPVSLVEFLVSSLQSSGPIAQDTKLAGTYLVGRSELSMISLEKET